MKILVIGNLNTGFRFFGPLSEKWEIMLADLETKISEDREDMAFYVEVEPIPDNDADFALWLEKKWP